MKFDVIIGNPPYQESDGGAGVSATPVYNKFIEAAKSLNPEVMDLIIPAKWYSGGKGLDQFRENMLNDSKISTLVDYTSSLDVFPGVDVAGGVCYFIRNENHEGECDFINYHNGVQTRVKRKLNEFSTFIRYPIAANIVKKVSSLNEDTLNNHVSSRKPFGLATKERPMTSGDITLRYNGGMGPYKRSEIKVGKHMIDKWKVIISRLTAEHAGQPNKDGKFKVLSTMEILEPKVICSETYLVAGYFDTKKEAENYVSYLKTKFVRFLLLQIAITQQVSKATFSFVPLQDFSKPWNDKELYKKYNIFDEEIKFIESMIKEME